MNLPTKRINSIDELITCINECFDANVKTAPQAILALTYIAGYISIEEIFCLLGLPSNSTIKSIIKRHKDKERLNEFSITQDGMTRKLFYLSPTGFEEAIALFDDPTEDEFKRRKRGMAPIHDYSAGMSVLGLIPYRCSFEAYKEVGLALSLRKRTLAGSLRIDRIISFKDDLDTSILYIEQDMGTEKTATLVDKLPNYYAKNMMFDDTCIIFSFRNSKFVPTQDTSELDELIREMKAQNITLVELLKQRKYNCPLAWKILGDSGYLVINSPEITGDLTVKDMLAYKDRITEFSDEKYEQICKTNNSLSIKKFRGMARIMYGQEKEYKNALFNGYSVFTIPTTLIGNYLPYIIPQRLSYIDEITNNLRTIDKNITYYRLLSDPIYTDTRLSIKLRHIFTGADNMYALEYISRDLGALERCIFYRKNLLKKKTGFVVLMMVDSIEDTYFISELLDYYEVSPTDQSNMFFIIRDEWKLFLIDKKGNRSNYRFR